MLYDAIMTLINNYNLWWKGMKDIRQNHMLPLMRRIRTSPDTIRKIAEMEHLTTAARAMIASSEAPGMQPADEGIVEELNRSADRRRMAIPPRTKQRYRRQHTVWNRREEYAGRGWVG